MPMPAHMTMTGNQQGEIAGSCEMKGREGTIIVYGEEHVIEIPRDTHSGLPTGKRIHHPLTVTKEFDKASPMLYQALCSGEQLSPVTLKYYRIDPQGAEQHYFTVELHNAIIVSMEPYFPLTFADDSKPFKHMEKLSLTYEKIMWTFEDGGISAEDAWTAPKV